MRFTPLLLLLSLPALAQPKLDFNKTQIKATKVNGNVYVLEGLGGNIGVSAGDDGILIVDDQFAPLAPKIKAALKGISKKPLKWVLNTHHHADHVNGNLVFGAEAPVIAHSNVRKHLAQDGVTFNEKKPAPAVALPVITFDDSLSIHINGEEIRAIHLPAGHTDGDSMIFFTGSNVVHMGDETVIGGFPIIDRDSGGTLKGFIANIEKAIAELPKDVKVIPGHGPVTDINGLKEFLGVLQGTSAAVAEGIKQGKTLDQLKKEKVLAKWDKLGAGFVSTDAFTEMMFNELSPAAPAAKK